MNSNYSRYFNCASGETTNNIMLTSTSYSFPICFSFSSISLLSSPNLDILCIQQADGAPFYENYAKLYFDAKHLEKD